MKFSVSTEPLLKKAEKHIDRRRPMRALRYLSGCTAPYSPALAAALNRIWAQLPDRRLASQFLKTSVRLFPAEKPPVVALARFCLSYCTEQNTVRRLARSLPQYFRPLATEFHNTGNSHTESGLINEVALHYRTAVWIDEAIQFSVSPSRCCWAAALYMNHKYAEAAEVFAPCTEKNAQNPLPDFYSGLSQVLSAEVLIAQSNYEPALEILQRLAASSPFHGFPSMARALEGCDRYVEAAQCWRTCMECADTQNRIFFLTRTGTALRHAGCYDEALACFAEIRQLASNDAPTVANAWLNESLCAYAQHRFGEEITCCMRALDTLDLRDTTHRIRPLRYCADAEYRLHHFEAGAEHYRQALDCAHLQHDVRIIAQIETEWADNLREHAGDHAEAFRHYSTAIALFRSILSEQGDARESLAMALNGRGICAFHLRNYKGQIADGTVSIDILSRLQETPEILLRLSACLRNRADSLDRVEKYSDALDDYRRAAEVYRKACASAPHLTESEELPELLLCCGRMCDRMNRYDDAVDHYGHVLELLSHRPEPLVGLDLEYTALAALRRGYAEMRNTRRNFSLALQDFAHVRALTQDDESRNLLRIRASARYQTGELYAIMEHYDLAREAFQQADTDEQRLQDKEGVF